MSERSTASLTDPGRYLAEFERLARRRRAGPGAVFSGDARFDELWSERGRICRLLAATVAAGEYRFSPVRTATTWAGGKERALFCHTGMDQVVAATLARLLGELSEPTWPDGLHSYRRGRSAQRVVQQLAAYTRAHRAAHPPKRRGLWVFRGDVRRYGETVPVSPSSSLWGHLQGLVAGMRPMERSVAMALLRMALRPTLIGPTGGTRAWPNVGLPTGSPLQPLCNNLYLVDLDRALQRVEGAFYARFGDDLLFVHPERERVQAAASTVDGILAQLGLELNRDKVQAFYWTACGRPGGDWPHARAGSRLTYLGFSIDFRGLVSLKPERSSALIRHLRQRLAHLSAALPDGDERRLRALCTAVNLALDPRHALAIPGAEQLRHTVNDRSQLSDLDYRIAQLIAERYANVRGVRAFRRVTPARLRREGGYRSLVLQRNRASGSGAASDVA